MCYFSLYDLLCYQFIIFEDFLLLVTYTVLSICIICQVCSLSCASSDLRYWDLRQSTPVHTQQLPERCYSLSARHPLMVVGTADRNLIVFNLQNPQVLFVASRDD